MRLISAPTNGGGAALVRARASVTTPTLADGVSADVLLPLARGYNLYALTASAACWARVYLNVSDRMADSSRSQTADPDPAAGVVAELIGTTARWAGVLPGGWDDKAVPDGVVPVRVTNLSGAPQAITLTATFLPTEA